MSELQYVTKGNASPKDKPKVYFTCHPEDFDKYFKQICVDIFKTYDCTIFYTEDMSVQLDNENRDLDLYQMNLFVIPVTFRLLTELNRAMDEDYSFADDKHIPVLPLMMESNIDEFYTRRFGERQYISVYENDPTKKSYPEQLSGYMKTVFLDKETVERIRKAFDAYIFLSYRKKDRRYANELMQMIHSHSELEKLAIWYDEFLTPGESFMDNIRKILTDSKLFSLLVTPSLLEKPNFVMEHEYPAALRSNKPILPAQAIVTDPEQLKKNYADIPDAIDMRDESAFEELYINTLRQYAVTENRDDPEHNYLIGLAYLDGIDVEVDKEHGVRMIALAAESDYIPAIVKLVSMYGNGKGVKRDDSNAAEWQRKLVECYKSEFHNNPTADIAMNIVNSISELSIYLFRAKEYDKASESCREAVSLCGVFKDRFSDDRFLQFSMKLYQMVGIYRREEGNLESAEESLKNASRIGMELIEKRWSYNIAHESVELLREWGHFEQAKGNLKKAKSYFEMCLDYSEYFNKICKSNNIFLQRELTIDYDNLGGICMESGETDEALKWYNKCVPIRESLVQMNRNDIYLRDLSIVYESIGRLALSTDDYASAARWFRKCLPLRKEILEETDSIDARRELARCYYYFCTIAMHQKNYASAREWCKAYCSAFESLVEEYDMISFRRELSLSYSKMGEIETEQKNYSEAYRWYLKAYELNKSICEKNVPVDYYHALACDCESISGLMYTTGKYSDAVEWNLKSVGIREFLTKKLGTEKALRELGALYYNLGINASNLLADKDTEMWLTKAVTAMDSLSQRSGLSKDYHHLALAYYHLGSHRKDMSLLEQALSIWRQLSEMCPDVMEYKRCKDIVLDLMIELY